MITGRPTKLTDALIEKAAKYANSDYMTQSEVIPTIEGLAVYLDVSRSTIYNWKTQQTPQGVYRWHIGGFGKGEVEMVQEAVDVYRKAVRAVETYMAD